ncbi:MAG TPA: hypothetical protein PLX62_06940 [Bacteroidales bacterium]|nr:hypothetical protein [Bacteroidales bacterium]
MITDEEKKPKVLSTEELLKRFNAEKAGTPGAVNEELDPWGHRLVDPDSLLAGKASRPRVPEAQPVARDTTKPTAEFDGMLDWNTLEKAKKEYEREPRLSAKEYIQGLGNKVKSSVMGLGEMVLETPQGIESLSNAPAVMLTEAMIKRKLRRGEIDQETGDYLMTEAKSMTPRRTVTGNMLFTDTMPEEMLADGDLNTWFEKNKVRFSEMGDKYDKTASQYLKSGQFGKALGAVSYGIAESLAPTIAAAVIPGGAVALGVGVGSTAYDDVKDREDMTEAMKIADAVITGTFEWLFERFGTREMTKQLFDIYKKTGKTGIVNAVNSNAVQQLFAKAYKKFGVWFAPVHEGISEGLTTLGQNLAAIFSGEDPERKIGDGFWDSVLIGTGMGSMFSLVEKTAEKYRTAREGKAGPITGPLTVEEQDPEVMIRDLGKKYAYNGFNNEIPEQNFIKYGEMKDGRKVIIKSTNFATDPANMLVTIVDAENPESKPEMTKGNMIINSMDVPYEEWVANEMRNYQATMQQVRGEAAKATAPVQEGATIPIGEQLFNVTQVTDQGIVLNEIDKEGNLTANSQTITPDKYGEVFGMPADQAPQTQAPAEQAQPQAETTQQPAGEPAQPTTVSPQSRKVSDGKNEFTIIPQEDGNFRMSESFETQKEAEGVLKKLQDRYPKLTWETEVTDSGDLFTPDTYSIVAKPKQKPAAPVAPAAETPKVETPVAVPDVKAEAVQPEVQAPSLPDETAAEEEVQNAGEVETQPTKGIPTYSQKKQIVLDHFGGMYEDAAASTPEQIYEQVPEVTPEEARQIHAEIKGEFEAEQEKTRNAPDPFVSIAKAEGQVDLRPTEEQKKAGNYKKGHVNLLGFDISIENPAGSVRSGVSKDGTKWSNLMNNTYGYFRRTEGKDGDQVDVFIGDNLDSDAVYVVDQVDPETGVFDEHKVMLGFNSAESARENYLANYEPGWKGLGAISKMSLEGFKEWLGDAKRTRKPVDPNVPVKEKEEQKPSEDTRPVKKVKKKKGWPMSKADEARLSREPQSFEEAVYQFFLGGGRISMANYYRHFGRNNSERLKNIWMYSSKPNAIKLDLLNEVSIFQYHPELLTGLGDGAMDQANAFVDVIRGMGGKSDIRRELDRIQSRTAEALEGEDLTPEEKEITEFTDDVENLTDETLLDPDLLVIFELELNELGKSFADIKETAEKEPEYFYVFPYGLSDKQFNELKDILNDTDRQRQVKELVEKGRGNEITGQGDQAERGGETDESGTSGEETEEGGADEGRDESTEVTPEFAGDIFNAPEKKELPKLKSPEKISDFHKWLTPRWKDNFGTDFDAAKIPTFNQAKQRFYNESAIEYEGDKNAQKYINGIKNAEKKKYAKAYNEWILNGRPKDQEPERGELSHMGAQSVWMQLNKFYTPTEGHGLIAVVTPENAEQFKKPALQAYLDELRRLGTFEVTFPEQIAKDIEKYFGVKVYFDDNAIYLNKPDGKLKPEFAGEVLEQSKGGEYKYKMIARPFDKGAFPEDGFIRSENDPNGGFQILTYDRQMPVKEWNKWDLVPLSDIEDIKDKEFTDKDGDYSKITLKWWGNNRGADVSMYDTDGNLVEEPFGSSVKDIFTNIEEGYWIEKPAQEAAPGKTPVKEIWQMTKQDFAYSPLRYDGMPTTDGSGVFRAEENPDGTWNAWVESPDGKKDYWSRNASAGEAWDGGKRKTAYMNQEADAKSMDRHKEAVTQALNEGKPVPEEVLRNYIGLKDYLEKQKKKEAAKPKEKESPIPANYREQIDNLKAIALKESTGLDTNRRIAEINALETPTKAQIKERNQLRVILENTREDIAKRNDKVDYNIIPENKVREIRKLIDETRALDEAIGQRILRLQDERDAKEKSLQKRAGLFGDRKEEEERKSGMQPMFAGEIFEASSDNLQAALKPFNDAIKKAEDEWKRNAQLLDEKIALVLSGAQMEIDMEPPAEPATTKPIDKESLPKHEDFGEKIGGARKDMGITRTVRDTDALPAWRRKYFYADPSGVMNLGDPTIDTSKPFLVKWSKEVKSWSGTRTMGYPVTTIDTRETKIFNSEAEAEAYIPIYEVWKQGFRIRKKDGNYVITKTSSTGKVVEYATFPTEEEATTYLYSTEGATSLLNHKREDFSIPALDKVERTGKDWRQGRDVSTEEFMDAFGFRGGEFGNWVKPEERRVMLNAAYDSFMDLAEMLKVPPKAMSLSGELSIAFGARGTKGAAAHFEPGRAVINMTRMNGAGSLAHEWAHALDNYFGLQAAKKDYTRNEKGEVAAGAVMRTKADLLSKRGMRKELSELFDAIVNATQEKSVTRVMRIEEKQKAYDGQIKRLKDEAEALIRKFENGVRRYKYNRKAKKHEEVIVKATPEQIKKAQAIIDNIVEGKGTRPKWAIIPGSKGHMEYSYISPETMALEAVYKEVFGKSGLKRDGNGFYNLGYFADKAYAAREILDKALAGESETLSVPTEFLKVSKKFDRSRSNPYWSTKVEMFARAFEYFIETKLEDQKARADYLQYDKAPVYDAVYGMNPYPAGEERTALNELFQKFFDEVKTKEEGGRTTMFRTGNIKKHQLDIIKATNPMLDDYHTGIRSITDIKTAQEAFNELIETGEEAAPDFTAADMQRALQTGRITVYSSYPIKNGVFVTPSRMQAKSYAGDGTVYSEIVDISDVAWIDYIEGQYAKISGESNAFRTSNRGTFDPKNDNILFRVIGERGAGAIEGLLDNLSVARKMEEAGRSAKEVFLATGWQRGVDNLWRYETRDIELKKGVDFISKLKPQNEAFTEEVPLTDIIEDEELFNSYPELKDVKLTFYNYGSHPELERTGGFANPSEKTIGIGTENLAATNKGRSLFPGRFVSDGTRGVFRPGLEYRHLYVYDRDSFRSVLSHEIQHHIQRVEGFAEGATAVGAKRAGSPTILYEAAAGEVEARNVQRRLELTPDERRERMLIETEDVERGQQEIIRKEYDIQENRAIVPKTPQPTGLDALNRILGLDEEDDQRYEVKKQVEDLSKQLRTPVKVIGNRGELPANVQEEAKKQGVWENETLYGAWDPKTGTMFILLDDLMKLGPQRAAKEGVKTVLHEAVAHKGLPILLGDKGYADLVEEIYDSIPDDDLTLIRYQYDWTEDRELIAKEYLAMMAEDNVNPSLFKRIVAKIREWLRKYFNLSYTENDVYSLLRASRKNLEDTPEEERGFYRSRPKADNFDFAGEYVQAQGTYFRSRKAAVSKRNTTLGKAAEAYMEKAAVRTGKETLEGIREYIQDLSLPIRRFEEELLRRGGKQDNTSKPYRDMSLSFGRQEKLYNDYFEGKMKPILQAVADIKRAGMRGEDILPYIIAKHAIERNQAFRSRELKEWVEGHKENVPQDEVNAKMEELKDKDYSGVMGFDTEGKYTNPDELARDIVSEFEGQVDPKFIDNLWKKVSAATSEILDTWERGNQISPDQKQEYLSQFRYFVPLRGWREGAAKELVYTKGDGFSRSLQYAKGRKSLADNPLAYLLNVQFQAIAEQVDNEVKTSMVNLIIKNLSNNEMHEMATIKKLYYVKITLPDGTVEWEPTTIRPSQEMFDNGDARTKIYSEHERLRKPHQAREHEVYVRKPGGDMVMVFNGKHLSTAQAMNKQNYMYRTIFGNIYDARDLNKVMALMGHMNNMLKALYTSWNIVFPFTNFMRDFQEASITQQIKSKSGGKVIKNYRAAFPAIIRRIQGKQDLKNPMDQQLEDFYNLGGATGYTHMKSPEEIEKDINKEVARMVRKGTIAGGIGDAGHALLGAVERWNKIFEDATRFSVYLSSLAIGNTKEDAAIDAKEASVNFNRKGKGSKAWDSWFAFWNVALQSMQKNFKLAKDHTGRFSAIASSFVMLGFLEAMMNALTDDDDDPDSSYYNLNSYMRQNYLVIPLPQIGDLRKKGNKYLSIPLPQFWRGFKSMGSIGFDVATGRMKAGEAVKDAIGNFMGGLLPIDIGGFWKSGEFSFAPIAPTITKPLVEIAENRNYMGYTIRKEPFTKEQKKYLANAGLGKDNVNPAAKFFTDMLFRWSGGDSRYKYYTDKQGRTRKVILDVNPSTIEYLFKGYTGGTGGVVSDLITTVSQTLDPDEEVDFKNVPFVNKFLRQTPPAKWNIISEYYDLKEANDRDITLMKEYEKQGRETGNTSQYERMAEDEYRIERKMIFDSYEDQISDLTKGVTKDDTETSSLVIELMDMCVGEVKELEARYKRKY